MKMPESVSVKQASPSFPSVSNLDLNILEEKQTPAIRCSQKLIGFLSMIFVLVFSGCANIRLISNYDEQIDVGITAFQKKMRTHF